MAGARSTDGSSRGPGSPAGAPGGLAWLGDAAGVLAEGASARRAALDRYAAALEAAQAAHLAGVLRGGHPCPVCGAERHPAPAFGGPAVERELLAAREAALAAEAEERAGLAGAPERARVAVASAPDAHGAA
jgi:hypothetical protein